MVVGPMRLVHGRMFMSVGLEMLLSLGSGKNGSDARCPAARASLPAAWVNRRGL